ncbi:alpha-galactosidase [Candidatus Leptofilum sp.]|uniref:alpha-galactosidase n=1 Tax=Candidatus Leptofilum sp. TaxID=3241576 RepID=UPI003B5ADEEE
MIHFNPDTRTFNLVLQSSVYAMQVDAKGRLLHLAWGPRPVAVDELLSGRLRPTLSDHASFEFQTRRDEILTFGDTTNHEVTLKANFTALPDPLPAGDAPHLPIRDVRLRYVSHEIVTDAQPGFAPTHGLPTQNGEPRETLRIKLDDPVQPLVVTLCYRLTPAQDIIERWLELENRGDEPIEIEQLFFAALHLPNGTTELTSVSGAWAQEFQTQRERLPIGRRIIEHRSVQTGHAANPFFMLNWPGQAWEAHGTVYFGALAYSGSWQLGFEQLPSSDVRVHGGYHPTDFGLTLAAGAQYKTLALICGVCDEGWGGVSRRLHAFTCERILPVPNLAVADVPAAPPTVLAGLSLNEETTAVEESGTVKRPATAAGRPASAHYRPILYNSWEATYFGITEQNQVELAQKAAAVGVEMFCLDDGWFGGRRFDVAGLGDWTVSPDVFPNGLEPLIAEVNRLGMDFGLWVEPEMVNPDSDLYRAHPEWVLHFPGRPRTEARCQLILDFGREEVVAYIFNALDSLLAQYNIAFIKWDMNRNVSEPGSVVGKAIWQAHVAGVYGIIDRLRAKYPHVAFESCAGGGGRVDLGILGRTDQVWTSDNTDALDRLRIQEGFSLAYPVRVMTAWVTHEKNHQTGRFHELSTRFDVAMRGALGIGASLNGLDDAELKEYASYIAFYKRIRHIVQGGDLYRLERLEEAGASTILYVLPDGSEAVYSVVVHSHKLGQFRRMVPLRGLIPSATYEILDRFEKVRLTATGYELMVQGMGGDEDCRSGYSCTLHIRRLEAGD